MKKIILALLCVMCVLSTYGACSANKQSYVNILTYDIISIQDQYYRNKDYSYSYNKFKKDLQIYIDYVGDIGEYNFLLNEVKGYVEDALRGISSAQNFSTALNFIKWSYELSANKYAGVE